MLHKLKMLSPLRQENIFSTAKPIRRTGAHIPRDHSKCYKQQSQYTRVLSSCQKSQSQRAASMICMWPTKRSSTKGRRQGVKANNSGFHRGPKKKMNTQHSGQWSVSRNSGNEREFFDVNTQFQGNTEPKQRKLCAPQASGECVVDWC